MSCFQRLYSNRWFVHNQFMDLGNAFEIIVYYLLIGGITSLGDQDGALIISVLMCMVTH